jgi:hypothetical protein
MPEQTPLPVFWVLSGEVPTGPYSLDQLHDRLASGELSWQTPACPVGASRWLPLLRTPGVGPASDSPAPTGPVGEEVTVTAGRSEPGATPNADAASATLIPSEPRHPAIPSPPPSAASTTDRSPPSRISFALALAALLAGIGFVGYWLYDWLRPATATEVCELMEKATTAEEAKRYCTTRMHRMLHELYADPTNLNPNDHFVFTRETDGPKPGTKLVGFRGSVFFPAEGGRFQMEGHLVLIDSGGWKVDDMVVSGVEGVSLPGPVSMVDEYVKANAPVLDPSWKPDRASEPKGLTRFPSPLRSQQSWFEGLREWFAKNYKALLIGLAFAALLPLWRWANLPAEEGVKKS